MDYIFYYVYRFLERKTKARNPLDSTYTMLTLFFYLCVLPISGMLLFKVSGSLTPVVIILISTLHFIFFPKLLKAYYKKRVSQILDRFKNRTKRQDMIGYLTIVFLILGSTAIFFLSWTLDKYLK